MGKPSAAQKRVAAAIAKRKQLAAEASAAKAAASATMEQHPGEADVQLPDQDPSPPPSDQQPHDATADAAHPDGIQTDNQENQPPTTAPAIGITADRAAAQRKRKTYVDLPLPTPLPPATVLRRSSLPTPLPFSSLDLQQPHPLTHFPSFIAAPAAPQATVLGSSAQQQEVSRLKEQLQLKDQRIQELEQQVLTKLQQKKLNIIEKRRVGIATLKSLAERNFGRWGNDIDLQIKRAKHEGAAGVLKASKQGEDGRAFTAQYLQNQQMFRTKHGISSISEYS